MNVLSVFFLDDEKERHLGFKKKVKEVNDDIKKYSYKNLPYSSVEVFYIYDGEEAKKHLSSSTYDVIMLDHDLGFGYNQEITGYDVCKAIVENYELHKKSNFIVHSLNPVGAENMSKILKSYSLNVSVLPYAWLGFKFNNNLNRVMFDKPSIKEINFDYNFHYDLDDDNYYNLK